MTANLAKLQEQLSCPVCLDMYRRPKLLACTHALCEECADRLPVDVKKGKHVIKCPTCRKLTTLPGDDTANLPPAFLINTLTELYQEIMESYRKEREVSTTTNRAPLDDSQASTIPDPSSTMDNFAGRSVVIDICVPNLKPTCSLTICHLVADVKGIPLHCKIENVTEKGSYRISFATSHPSFHRAEMQHQEVSIYDNNGDYLGSIPSSGEAVAVDNHGYMYMCRSDSII